MRLVSGHVVGGRIEVEGEALPEGSSVVVVLPDPDDDRPALTPAERDALLASIAEADAGLLEDSDEVFRSLPLRR